jgi:hypothetical protein
MMWVLMLVLMSEWVCLSLFHQHFQYCLNTQQNQRSEQQQAWSALGVESH